MTKLVPLKSVPVSAQAVARAVPFAAAANIAKQHKSALIAQRPDKRYTVFVA